MNRFLDFGKGWNLAWLYQEQQLPGVTDGDTSTGAITGGSTY